jgi:hypothetical protein
MITTKITKCDKTNLFLLWTFKKSHTGIKCLDSNLTWRISKAFSTIQDAIVYQQSIK